MYIYRAKSKSIGFNFYNFVSASSHVDDQQVLVFVCSSEPVNLVLVN